MSYQPVKRDRPFSVTLLAIMSAVAGILSLVDAARYMGWLPIATFGEMKFVLPQAQWFAAGMAAIVGLIYFLVTVWLWNLNPSGWLFVVIVTIFNLIFLGLALIGKTSFTDVMFQILVNGLALILALISKDAFAPLPPSPEAVKAASASAASKIDAASDAAADKTAEVAQSAQTMMDPDDLTQIKGVGPEISHALQAAGINTYEDLANSSPEKLHQILVDAGISAHPNDWPKQAQLAAAGNWDDLKNLQDQLD